MREVIKEFAALPEIQELAKEPSFRTTQDSYGHYMQAIPALGQILAGTMFGRTLKQSAEKEGATDFQQTLDLMAVLVLRQAGGNPRGIDAAARIHGLL